VKQTPKGTRSAVFTIAHLSNRIGDTVALTNLVKHGPSPWEAIELTSLSARPEAVMSIKLLLVDDSDLMRSAIRQLLKKEPGIEVVGIARDFAECLVLNAALRPDILLMDLHAKDEREHTPELIKSQIRVHTDA
jgi:PleD family two-component response regulator